MCEAGLGITGTVDQRVSSVITRIFRSLAETDKSAGATAKTTQARTHPRTERRLVWPEKGARETGSGPGRLVIAIRPAESAEIVEADAVPAQHFMGTFCRHLPNVERIPNHEMVNGMGAAKVEAERLQR